MSFALLINPNVQFFDGTTFVPPSGFDYTRLGQNFFQALNNTGGPVGTFDPMGMLQTIADELGSLFDRGAVDAGSPAKITDLILERALTNSGNEDSLRLGTQSPPLPGVPTGVRLFTTPTEHVTDSGTPWRQHGGSGQLDADPAVAPGGCVTLPTGMRMFAESEMQNPASFVTLWLVPFKNPATFAQLCCCASKAPTAPPIEE